jgi:hypothetical protein
MSLEKEFEAKLKVSQEVEEEVEKAEDDKKANEIINGTQTIHTKEFGTLVFDYPSIGLAMEGDFVYAKYKTEHLRKNDLLTEAQLKAIYSRPVTIEINGKEEVVGEAQWPVEKEDKLETLPKDIRNYLNTFNQFREEIQEIENEILALTETEEDKAKKVELENKKQYKVDQAYDNFLAINNLRLELLDLQATRAALFSSSLEEQANFERIKLYAPSCIRKKNEDGTLSYLWSSSTSLMQDSLLSAKILSMFNLFLRGADISFFDDTQGVLTQP